jgi:hypothetical protein
MFPARADFSTPTGGGERAGGTVASEKRRTWVAAEPQVAIVGPDRFDPPLLASVLGVALVSSANGS